MSHPSSADSLSTSAAKEDHVSMGGFAARKALSVVEHVETVSKLGCVVKLFDVAFEREIEFLLKQIVAIELLAACQALDLLRPLHTTECLERVYDLVRSKVEFGVV